VASCVGVNRAPRGSGPASRMAFRARRVPLGRRTPGPSRPRTPRCPGVNSPSKGDAFIPDRDVPGWACNGAASGPEEARGRAGLLGAPARAGRQAYSFTTKIVAFRAVCAIMAFVAAGARASIRYALSRALSVDPLLPEMIFGECDEAHTHCAEMGASRGH